MSTCGHVFVVASIFPVKCLVPVCECQCVWLQVNTVPQGVIDMNLCVDVYGAEEVTGHQFSIAVEASQGKTTYMKGNTQSKTSKQFVTQS